MIVRGPLQSTAPSSFQSSLDFLLPGDELHGISRGSESPLTPSLTLSSMVSTMGADGNILDENLKVKNYNLLQSRITAIQICSTSPRSCLRPHPWYLARFTSRHSNSWRLLGFTVES